MLRNVSFVLTNPDLCKLVKSGDFLGQLVDPTNPTNRPDQPDQPTRPTGPIWGISIKSGNFVIFALERVVDTINFHVLQSW